MSEQAKSCIEIQWELLHIYGSVAAAMYDACTSMTVVDRQIDVGPLSGSAACIAGWYSASGNPACSERDEAINAARTVVGDAASEAIKESRDVRSVVEASCRSVMKNCASIRAAIRFRLWRINRQTMKSICASVLRLLTYSEF